MYELEMHSYAVRRERSAGEVRWGGRGSGVCCLCLESRDEPGVAGLSISPAQRKMPGGTSHLCVGCAINEELTQTMQN